MSDPKSLTRPPKRLVDGILLLDKPVGITSNRAWQIAQRLYRAQINTVLANDFHFTKLNTLERSADYNIFRRVKRGEEINPAERAKFGRLLK